MATAGEVSRGSSPRQDEHPPVGQLAGTHPIGAWVCEPWSKFVHFKFCEIKDCVFLIYYIKHGVWYVLGLNTYV